MTTLQQQVQAQNESGGGKIDQVSGQMQGINDSVDALRTRIDKLSAQVTAIQSQLQNIDDAGRGATAGRAAGTTGQQIRTRLRSSNNSSRRRRR